MPSYNKVLLMGHLTRDTELRYLPGSQTAVVDFGIASNRNWTGKDGQTRTSAEILADEVIMLGSPQSATKPQHDPPDEYADVVGRNEPADEKLPF